MVEEAEAFLAEQGFRQVRVRHYGSVATIEVGSAEQANIMDKGLREAIVEKFRGLGFEHVALDLEGYISGKMNRVIRKQGQRQWISNT